MFNRFWSEYLSSFLLIVSCHQQPIVSIGEIIFPPFVRFNCKVKGETDHFWKYVLPTWSSYLHCHQTSPSKCSIRDHYVRARRKTRFLESQIQLYWRVNPYMIHLLLSAYIYLSTFPSICEWMNEKVCKGRRKVTFLYLRGCKSWPTNWRGL